MITAEYDKDLNVMRFTLRGRISLSMMVGAALAWMKSSNYQPDAPALWDLRDSDWSQINIKFTPCHPAGITAGYILAGIGSLSFWVTSYPWSAVMTGSLLALLLAGFIALRRPISRHHAGFIAATSLLVNVFTAIHRFLHI